MQNHLEITSKNQFWIRSVQNWMKTYFLIFCMIFKSFGLKTVFFELLHAKPCRTIMKSPQKVSFGPERTKLDKNSDFGHVRTYSSLHKLRNTQGKIHGTYLGNIYGIYKECIRNIHRYLWYKIIRNTDPMGRPHWGAAEGGACVSDYFIS